MKKTLLTIAIVLGMTLGAVAQKQGGGLFGKGDQRPTEYDEFSIHRDGSGLLLPSEHGSDSDQTPLGTGALLLIGFGAAYAMKKRQK